MLLESVVLHPTPVGAKWICFRRFLQPADFLAPARLIKPSETEAKSGSELTAGRSVSDKHNKFLGRGHSATILAIGSSAQGSKNYGNWFSNAVRCVALSLSGAINSAPRRLISSLKCSYFAALVAPTNTFPNRWEPEEEREPCDETWFVCLELVFILYLMDQFDRNLIFKYRDVVILHTNGRKTNAEQFQQRMKLIHLREIYSSISSNWLFVPLFKLL